MSRKVKLLHTTFPDGSTSVELAKWRGKYACPFHDFTSAKAAEMEDHIRKVHDAQEVQSTDNSDGINYEVERLVDRRINRKTGTVEYLVKWTGWDDSDSTWEPFGHLAEDLDLVNEYDEQHPFEDDEDGQQGNEKSHTDGESAASGAKHRQTRTAAAAAAAVTTATATTTHEDVGGKIVKRSRRIQATLSSPTKRRNATAAPKKYAIPSDEEDQADANEDQEEDEEEQGKGGSADAAAEDGLAKEAESTEKLQEPAPLPEAPIKETPELLLTELKGTTVPTNEWHDLIDYLRAQRLEPPDTVIFRVYWKNGAKSTVHSSWINVRAPNHVLKYYESVVVFSNE